MSFFSIQTKKWVQNFSLDTFKQEDLPDLLINIWEYSHPIHANSSISKKYKEWSTVAAKEKWSDFYHDFDKVINSIATLNENWHNFGEICSAEKNIIYKIITKPCYGGCCSDVVTKL